MEGLQYVTLPLSGTISENFLLRNTTRIGVHAPGMTSCQLLFQASNILEDPTSASFHRVWREDGSTPLAWNVGSANAYLPAGRTLVDAVWGRIESSVAQAQVSTVTIVTQGR